MLSTEERWKINHAAKFMGHALTLLEECHVRPGDPDSAVILEASRRLIECSESVSAVVERFGTIPDIQPPKPRRPPSRWALVSQRVIDREEETV